MDTMAAVIPVVVVNGVEAGVAGGVAAPTLGSPSEPGTSGGGKVGKSHKKYLHDKNSVEYKKRRERNNVAVRKSRDKSRVKTQETLNKIEELKVENTRLENKVKLLSKELSVLKDLFLAKAEELPDPSTTFGLFNSGASNKLTESTEPESTPCPEPEPALSPESSLGSKFAVASTIEVSADGEVAQISDGDDTVELSRPVVNALNNLTGAGHQIIIAGPRNWVIDTV